MERYLYIKQKGLHISNHIGDYIPNEFDGGLYFLGTINILDRFGGFKDGGYISVTNYDKMPGQKPKPTFYKICKILKKTDITICFDGYSMDINEFRNEIIGDFINE